MKLFVVDGRLLIEVDGGDRFVVVPCCGHGYHIKPVAEILFVEPPRELTVSEAQALTLFIANGFV